MKLLHLFRRWPGLAATAFVAVVATAAVEAPAATPTPEALRAQAEALLAHRLPADGPGAVLLIARGDQVLYRGARGLASLELRVPLAPDQALRIGSVTKQFAAATLLQLVDQGRAALTDPLSKFLPAYPGGERVTLAQLLNHTSGIKSYTGIRGYMDQPIRRDLSTAELVAVFSGLPTDFAPGTAWAYNNSGYVLVGAVIEAITGQPWHEAVSAMARAQGLTRTVFGANDAVIPAMADGYSRDGARVVRAGFLSMTQPHAAGALVSTVDDLLKWNLALHGGRVLQPESYRRMTTPEGEPAQKARYGYGIGTASVRQQAMLVHTGGIHGFSSALAWLPEAKLSVVVLANADNAVDAGALARRAVALALGEPYPDGPTVAVPAAELQALAGRWQRADGAGDEFLVRVADGGLSVQGPRGPARGLRAIGGGRFIAERGLSRVEFGAGGTARFFVDAEAEGVAWRRVGELPAGK